MASRKLKRKIWELSLATTMISIGIMMYIPTLYFQVLPILIPSSIITVIMPTYFLEPNKSTNKENETKNTNNTISENSIKIVLPNFEKDVDLTEDERIVYKILSKNLMKSISEIAPYVPFGKSKTTQLLKAMGEKGVVAVEGKGRGTKYIIK